MNEEVTESASLENLEIHAINQRHQMHKRAEELRGKVAAARERLDVKNTVREHFTAVALASSLIAIGIGISAGGMFRRRQDGTEQKIKDQQCR